MVIRSFNSRSYAEREPFEIFFNIVVATKAWNLLFSIMDWAKAKQVGENAKEEPANNVERDNR
jgi:hypothetical protein